MAGCLGCGEKITLVIWCGCARPTLALGQALRQTLEDGSVEREGIEFRLADRALQFLEEKWAALVEAMPAGRTT